VALHRRHLPLAYRCEGFVPAPGSTGDGGFCEQCHKQVHDVSTMREGELRRLLARHAGGTVCLAYRTDARGRVRLRPEPMAALRGSLATGALGMLLAACAGHATELEIPGADCRDEDGYAVSCAEPSDPDMLSVPEADEVIAMREVEDPSVRPLEPVPADEVTSEPVPADDGASTPVDPASPVAEASEATATGTTVDMSEIIDLDAELMRGIVAVVDDGWIERDFRPTDELVEEARDRRAERKAARQRWRAARRRAAASR
jgi:hypothetical protein